MDKPRYIDLDFLDALQLKYAEGAKKHRRIDAGTFTGDPIAELYEELLDCIHYCTEAERQGKNVDGLRTTFRNMALALQKDHRR